MSSSSVTSVSQADIIESSEPVQALLNNPPCPPQPGLAALVDWIIKVDFTIVGMVTNLAKQLVDQADEAYETARQADDLPSFLRPCQLPPPAPPLLNVTPLPPLSDATDVTLAVIRSMTARPQTLSHA